MSKRLLDSPNVVTILKQLSREGMTHGFVKMMPLSQLGLALEVEA